MIEIDAPSRPDLVALSQIGIRSLVSVPLMKAGRFVVNLNVHDARLRVWTDDEIGLISEIAERSWGAAERARSAQTRRTMAR